MRSVAEPATQTMPRVGLVVPCYNEEARIDRWSFLKFAQSRQWLHFYFVNDGSTDATADILHEMAGYSAGRMHVLELPSNRGKAEAVRLGMLAACDDGCEIIGFWDADLATPLEEVTRMCAVLMRRCEIEVVVGTRLRLAGRRIERNRIRAVLGRIFARLATSLLSLPLTDTQCGAKLFRCTEVTQDALRTPFVSSWVFDVELLKRCAVYGGAHWLGKSIYEFPLENWREVGGSKVRGRDFITAGGELLRIWWRYHRGRGALGRTSDGQGRAPVRESGRRAA